MIEEQNLSIFLQTLCKYESMACYYYFCFVLFCFLLLLDQIKENSVPLHSLLIKNQKEYLKK